MSAEIILLDCDTKLNIPPERALSSALGAGLTQVVIVGLDPNGELYFASSQAATAETLLLLKLAEKRLLELADPS